MIKKIRTAYIGPTDTKGARIRATGGGRQMTVAYDYAAIDSHAVAAAALAGVSVDRLKMVDQNARGNVYVVTEG